MRVAMLGFGLIGGSIARATAAGGSAGAWEIAAWTPSGRGPTAALRDGVIAEAAPTAAAAVRGAALVVLAGPPNACIELLDDLAGQLRSALDPDVVVTDVASTKTAITLRAAALDLPFVGGHPMAGLERSGYEASTGDLFVQRPWIIVPSAAPERDARVRELAVACGARPLAMTAAAHDRAVAAISHLPLVAAASLVTSVLGSDALDEADRAAALTLAAGGWRDMTRLARGDVAMGTGIAVTNAAALAERIRAYVDVLEAWLADLEAPGGPDRDAIELRLQAARAALEEPS
ncbi:MAG: prephenate dehydrogenase [Candidatus Limnocylindria bacterium]